MEVREFCTDCEDGLNGAQKCADCKTCRRDMEAELMLEMVNYAYNEDVEITITADYKYTIIPNVVNAFGTGLTNAIIAISLPDAVVVVDGYYIDGDVTFKVGGEGRILKYSDFIKEMRNMYEKKIIEFSAQLIIPPTAQKNKRAR